MNKGTLLIGMAAASLFAAMASAETFRLNSPDGKIEALVSDGKTLTLDVSADGKKLLEKVEFAMDTDRGALGKDASAVSCDYSNHRGAIDTVWGIEKSVRDDYNQMELNFKKFKVIVRRLRRRRGVPLRLKLRGRKEDSPRRDAQYPAQILRQARGAPGKGRPDLL